MSITHALCIPKIMKPNKKIQRWEHSEIDVYHKSFMRNTISMFISYSWNDHFTLLINQKSYLQGINKQFTHASNLTKYEGLISNKNKQSGWEV